LRQVMFKTIIMTMLMVNIAEAKAKLSEYVEAVAKGEHVIICNRNRPVAELRPIEVAQSGPRDLSPMFPGAAFMTEAFFDPMTDGDLREWYGQDAWPAKVAESKGVYGAAGGTKPKKKPRS
jgi:prevent-host-death family protein